MSISCECLRTGKYYFLPHVLQLLQNFPISHSFCYKQDVLSVNPPTTHTHTPWLHPNYPLNPTSYDSQWHHAMNLKLLFSITPQRDRTNWISDKQRHWHKKKQQKKQNRKRTLHTSPVDVVKCTHIYTCAYKFKHIPMHSPFSHNLRGAYSGLANTARQAYNIQRHTHSCTVSYYIIRHPCYHSYTDTHTIATLTSSHQHMWKGTARPSV